MANAPRRLAASPEAIAEAAAELRAGELVAFPTETVYGLGADATNDRAVAAIFEAKGRPRFNPLICHFASADEAREAVDWPAEAVPLAAAFWPGPLTLVLPRRSGTALSPLVSAGLPTAAVRVPAHPVAHSLLEQVGGPVAAPSANRSGHISPTEASHVAASLGDRVALILDGGRCAVGLESTVVDLSGERPVLLRAGGVAPESIEQVIGPLARAGRDAAALRSPGMLASHYAPSKPFRLGTAAPGPREGLLAFGPEPPAGFRPVVNLSRSGDLVEAAANLFGALYALEAGDCDSIAAMPVPDRGLGIAINDRLRRAAAERGQPASPA